MKIIDAHVHIVEKERNFDKALTKLLDELKNNSVDYAIVIPDSEQNTECADTETVIRLIKGYNHLFALGAYSLWHSSLEKMEEYVYRNLIHGIKLFPGFEPFCPCDKRLFALYELCCKSEIPVVFHTWGEGEHAKYTNPAYIEKIAKHFPKLRIAVAHLFVPKIKYCLQKLLPFKNVYFDISALASEDVMKKAKEELKFLKRSIEKYPERFVFGSDYPACSIAQHLRFVRSLNLSENTRRKLLFENAETIYGLNMSVKL